MWAIAALAHEREDSHMKRLVAAPLWFLVGWYVGTAAAWVLDVSPALGVVLAVVASAFVLADPRRVIWQTAPRHS
jgi:hypothetical protein